MCGFVVLCGHTSTRRGHDVCESISHRGPDSCGHVTLGAPAVEMHFRRLAIRDLDRRSDQPFGDPAVGVTVYNGELYNIEELRDLLAARGYQFSTSGDTEVMHALLSQPDWRVLLGRADGMYAFVRVDADGSLRFGRDRAGIKPLYQALATDGRLLGLASEIAPLRQAGMVREVDVVAVAASAMFLWVPPPATGWHGCQQVEPGSVTQVDTGTGVHHVFRIPDLGSGDPDIRNAVRSSLRRQVQADVPVALLLSGGLDSTWLAYELAAMDIEVPFLSARFVHRAGGHAEPFQDDAPYAKRVAEELGRSPVWFDVGDSSLREIPAMVDAVEQPFGDPAAIALLGLSRAAADHATVLLSGLGVEEVFLGYQRYQAIQALSRVGPLPRWLSSSIGKTALAHPRLRERATKFRRMAMANPDDWTWVGQSYYDEQRWARLFPAVPLEHVTSRHREETRYARSNGASHLEAAAHVDRELFLPGLNLHYGDRASMRSSVELRVPFLGDPVLAAAGAYPAGDHVGLGNGKRLFRAAARRAGVPAYVVKRSKTGFGAPVRSIFRTHGAQVWAGIRDAAIFDDLVCRDEARTLFEEHVAGRSEQGLQLFGLTSLAVWWESHVRGDGSIREFLGSRNPDEVSAR